MTMTIDVSPEEEVRLREEANRRGETPDDLLRAALINLLGPATVERPAWGAAAGMFAYPLCGEDAQAWVTRTREEDTERREQGLRGPSMHQVKP